MFKVIFTSITATLIVISLVASIFLKSILGVFGLAYTSIESIHNLQASKQIIDKVKKRHKSKKLNASKKFISRSSKKIASAAVTAATIGTAGVVITVAALEVYDYCEDKKELNEDGNILFNANHQFDYSQCLADAKKTSNKILISVKKTAPEMVYSVWENTKNISEQTWHSLTNWVKSFTNLAE
jgi:hypothetical protein